MAVGPGTRLGVYEITAQIGEGGMGQVYRATDTRLKRQVAIKILPPFLAADGDRLEWSNRSVQEAEFWGRSCGVYGSLMCRAHLRPTIRQHEGPQVQSAVSVGTCDQGRILATNAFGFERFERSTSLIRLTKSKNNSQ